MKPDQHTALYAVVGNPVRHSLSPAMHNAAFSATGINAVYLAFEPPDMGAFIQAVQTLGIKGISVTMPFKTTVIPHLSHLDPLAERVGAVNTVINEGGRVTGCNTDGPGAVKALEETTDLAGRRIILVGAGGAARAVGLALKDRGAALSIVNRSRHRGEGLARLLGCEFIPPDKIETAGGDILIQTTPAGMAPHEDVCPVPPEALKPGMAVMDLVYRPVETRLLQMARQRGCATVSGIRMLIHQGAEQFRLWTGLEPPVSIMERAVKEALRRPHDNL
ncbi:MAG: shikimate dehydrogenase [Desulfococcus sp. 4484_242]|nr:MAG: shikimate dehydrogenase [Desulfococcus sp. 4484_242]